MPTRYYRGKDGTLLVSRTRPLPPPDTYSSSGGSILSTAPDLARWLLMIRNGGRVGEKVFLAPETVADMLAKSPGSRNARGGLFIRKKDASGKAIVIGHTGSSGTNCWIDFEHDLIGIMLTQTRGKDITPFRIKLEKQVTECVSEPGAPDSHLGR
jgi:CubicO group peptidase (beta-lactamase class C family)